MTYDTASSQYRNNLTFFISVTTVITVVFNMKKRKNMESQFLSKLTKYRKIVVRAIHNNVNLV